jgi:hypothetical protein
MNWPEAIVIAVGTIVCGMTIAHVIGMKTEIKRRKIDLQIVKASKENQIYEIEYDSMYDEFENPWMR